MELIYLWIEEYKNIKNQEFNFSSRFDCKYNKCDKELTIIKNKDYIDIFPENINVTAIAGKNGSGKSNIFQALLYEDKFSIDNKVNFWYIVNKDDKDNFEIYYFDNKGIKKDKIILNKAYNIKKFQKNKKIILILV